MKSWKFLSLASAAVGLGLAAGCITDPGAALTTDGDALAAIDGIKVDESTGAYWNRGRNRRHGGGSDDSSNANESPSPSKGNGNDNGGVGNKNDNGGAGNTNDNGGVVNGNDNGGVVNGNDNGGVVNGNDNGGVVNGNDNGGVVNGNDNGGVMNGNDNGAANGNDNGFAATCPDGSSRLRHDPMAFESRARWRQDAGGCMWFNVRTQDWPTSSTTVDVTVNGVVVGQMSIDDRGRGELTFDSSLGTMPAGFPSLNAGDVISIGGQSSGALAVDCSMTSGCGS